MNKQRARMPKSQRAKQFAPFDAVVGLRRALRNKEKIKEPRRTLSEDMADELNRKLINAQIGTITTVVYYNKTEEQYFQLTGHLTQIEKEKRIIVIEETEISIDDLYGMY